MSLTIQGGSSQRPASPAIPNTWTALQTFNDGLTVSAGTTTMQVLMCTTLTVSGGGIADVSSPAVSISNDRILTLKGTAGYTDCSFVWCDSSNRLNVGVNNLTRLQFAISGIATFSNSATPGTAPVGQVLIGGGAINAAGEGHFGGGVSCASLTSTGKITSVSAVPASFADLAAVRTWLVAQFT